MIYLAAFPPLAPEIGQFFWTTIIFLMVWLILGKTAFRPINNSLKKRENHIHNSLEAANLAKKELMQLEAEKESMLTAAREERMKILAEAKDMKNSILAEARDQAKEEAGKIIKDAHIQIDQEKNRAITTLKAEVATMALDIAEGILKENLKSNDAQQKLAKSLLEQASLS